MQLVEKPGKEYATTAHVSQLKSWKIAQEDEPDEIPDEDEEADEIPKEDEEQELDETPNEDGEIEQYEKPEKNERDKLEHETTNTVTKRPETKRGIKLPEKFKDYQLYN